jgi:DNA-directed RNA polymerase specialized sigma subunit
VSEPQSADELIVRCNEITTELSRHHDAILTLSQERARLVVILNQRYDITIREIGKRLGISGARVAQIMNLVRWKTEVAILFSENSDK